MRERNDSRYEQFEISPETIEQEMRAANISASDPAETTLRERRNNQCDDRVPLQARYDELIDVKMFFSAQRASNRH